MQRHTSQAVRVIPVFAYTVLMFLSGGLIGCGGSTVPTNTGPKQSKSYSGITLTVACNDKEFAKEITDRSAGWAGRTGATVKVIEQAPATVPQADIAIIAPIEIGSFAAKGQLNTAPANLKNADNPLQWNRVAAVHRLLCSWGRDIVAMPLAGDAYVVVYRADRFEKEESLQKKFAQKFVGRTLAPPATWEEVFDIATFFAENDGKPSLSPFPVDRNRFLTLFHQIAACYDRKALADSEHVSTTAGDLGTSLHFDPIKWETRLDSPGFVTAADWFERSRSLCATTGSDDPVKSLEEGRAVLAVLSLTEVGRLPRDAAGVVAERFKIAPLPGSRTFFDTQGGQNPAGRQGNFVPFLGFGGKVGVVFQRSEHAEAAWDMLFDFASPSASLSLMSNPALGVGPFRTEHADPGSDGVWLGYRFDANRTRDLATAARHYMGLNVINPALALKTPDQAELMNILETELRKVVAGKATGAEAIRNTAAAWRKLDARQDRETLTKWRRNAIGLP